MAADPAVPGAFVGLSRERRAATPASSLAGAGTRAARRRRCGPAGRPGSTGSIAGYSSCPDGRAVIVEAAGTGPGDAGLVYVQIAPPAGSGPAFVDTLLAGVRVR